jgi:hypothetical protein
MNGAVRHVDEKYTSRTFPLQSEREYETTLTTASVGVSGGMGPPAPPVRDSKKVNGTYSM